MNRVLLAAFCLSLSGCPLRVDPPTDRECPQRATCGICASDPNCAWLATPDGERRRCYPRAELTPEDRGIQLTEMCPEDGPLGTRAPETSP